MARVHEMVLDPQRGWSHREEDDDDSALDKWSHVQVASSPRAESAYAALMECAPGIEPAAAQDDLYPLREVIQDAIEDVLDEREQWIFDAIVVERLSFAQVARQLSLAKSYVHRIYQASCSKLAAALEQDTDIIQHLKGTQ